MTSGGAGSHGRWPLRALLGTLLFVLLVPANVIVVVPWLVHRGRIATPLLGLEATRWLGVAAIAAGLPLFVGFLVRFVREGHGTPAPVAPTRYLVVGGPFRWTRNPGYIGVLLLVLGQALVFGSPGLLAYAAALAIGFHAFVVLYEEPTLRRSFGAEYDEYCRRVPRWIPRPTRTPPAGGGL